MIDSVVVEHYGERLAAIGPEHVPAGWELIHLVGGPYDGAGFIQPEDQPGLPISLPVTFVDRQGMATFARYSPADESGTARFVDYLLQRNPGSEESECETDEE